VYQPVTPEDIELGSPPPEWADPYMFAQQRMGWVPGQQMQLQQAQQMLQNMQLQQVQPGEEGAGGAG
jgi:hypothetical protein